MASELDKQQQRRRWRRPHNLGHVDWQPRLGGNHYHLQGFIAATVVFVIVNKTTAVAAIISEWRHNSNVTTRSVEPRQSTSAAASRPSSMRPRHRPRSSNMTTSATAAADDGDDVASPRPMPGREKRNNPRRRRRPPTTPRSANDDVKSIDNGDR